MFVLFTEDEENQGNGFFVELPCDRIEVRDGYVVCISSVPMRAEEFIAAAIRLRPGQRVFEADESVKAFIAQCKTQGQPNFVTGSMGKAN